MEKAHSNQVLLSLLSRLWQHLSSKRKRQFFLLAILMVLSAAAEVLSLGTLLPFLGVLTSPDKLFQNEWFRSIANYFSLTKPKDCVFPFTIAFVFAALSSGTVRLLLLKFNTKLAYSCGSDFSCEVYRRTLYQPYSVHVSRNSSTLISGITVKVALAVNVLYQLLTLFSCIILLTAIGSALLVISPLAALSTSLGFGFCYLLISFFSRKQLFWHGQVCAREQNQAIKVLQEGLGGIRDIILDSTQPLFCEIYRRADVALRESKGNIIFLSGRPRFIMETAGMVMVAAFAFFASQKPDGIIEYLPVLATLALGAQRMLPVLQQGYAAWSAIIGDQASLSDTIDLLDQPISIKREKQALTALDVYNDISFQGVTFKYTTEGSTILNDLNLRIPRGARIGIVGPTGSGKSTVMDLLMGLLTPTAGVVCVDGVALNPQSIPSWQKSIAHVPQSIYLADASILENIAFGIPKEKIDLERAKLASRKAQIDRFIEGSPLRYDTLVGERGVRLSGGQRQRLGLARAFYKSANVIVLDEATSALDHSTEKAVMDSIFNLERDLTVVIIAHRLSTLSGCDSIFEINNGRITELGSYQELLKKQIPSVDTPLGFQT